MSRTTSLHDDAPSGAIGEESFELGTREAMLLDQAAVRVSDGDLEDILCEVSSGGFRIYVESLLGLGTLLAHGK